MWRCVGWVTSMISGVMHWYTASLGPAVSIAHRCGRCLTGVAALAAASACTPTLYGYERVRDSDQYIADATREAIVAQGLSLEQVVQQLGAPDGTNEEAHTIGYSRCVQSTGWGVFGPGNVDNC